MRTEDEGRELLAAVKWWQSCEEVHPLTCPDHSDTPLQSYLHPAAWIVYLFCPEPNCQCSQAWVPDSVLEAYRARMKDG